MNQRIKITFICFGLSLLTAGCATTGPTLQARSNFAHNPPSPAAIYEKRIKGNKILFVADNQKAMIKAEPIFEQDYFSEKSLNTAHRRAALDAFSLDILKHIFNTEGHDLVIHAGDLLNNSCLEEYKDVEQLLNANKRPWFVAPGNHDGYYMGLSSPTDVHKGFFQLHNGASAFLDERASWALICNDVVKKRELGDTGNVHESNYKKYEQSVVDKTAFNGLYLGSLGVLDMKHKATRREMGRQPGHEEYEGYDLYCLEFDSKKLYKGYMSNICWTEYRAGDTLGDHFNNFTYKIGSDPIDWWEEKKPWLNFVVQKLEVKLDSKTVDIIIIDTSSYTNGVAIKKTGAFLWETQGAANAGHLSLEQYNALAPWLGSGRDTYIVGHHPVGDFDMESFERLHSMFDNKKNKVIKYISGDTHDGYDVEWKKEDEPATGYLVNESNLGATIDAPIEYAVLGQSRNKTIFKRISITPLKETRVLEEAGSIKKSNIDGGMSKDYAVFKNETWSGLCGYQNQWVFLQSDVPYDPFLQLTPEEQRKFEKNVEVPQKSWMHYVLNPFTTLDVQQKSLEAYKISRLSQLVNVYDQLFEYADIVKSNKAIELTKEYEKSLNKLKRQGRSAYSDDKEQPFNQVLFDLNLLINELEKHDFSSRKAKSFRLCSALYEAEREYRKGWKEDKREFLKWLKFW